MAEALVQAQAERNHQAQVDGIRKCLERHSRQIECCDGADRERLRDWLEAVTAAKTWTGAGDQLILEMCGYLSKGPLRQCIAARREQPQEDLVTWEEIVQQVRVTFLNDDEAEILRDRVEKIRQQPYQDTREYGVKFMTGMNRAYTAEELQTPLVMQRLVNIFINGLRDKEVRTQVYLERPQTVAHASTHANSTARAVIRAEPRQEEAMDVGAVPTTTSKLEKTLDEFTEKMTRKMAKLEQRLNLHSGNFVNNGPRDTPRRRQPRESTHNPPRDPNRKFFGKPSFNEDGSPNCYNCGRRGHMARDCRRSDKPARQVNE